MKEKSNKLKNLFKKKYIRYIVEISLFIIITVVVILCIYLKKDKSPVLSSKEVTKIVSEKYLETNNSNKVDYNIKYFDNVTNVYIVEVLDEKSGEKVVEYGVNALTKEVDEVDSCTNEMN